MKFTKLYMSKNDKKEKDNQPDILFKGITDEGIFVDLGAFWKAKSGKGYSGKPNEHTTIENNASPVSKDVPNFDQDSKGNEIKYPAGFTSPKEEEINPDSIPF